MDLEGTVTSETSEVRQSETNPVWLHLYVESKKGNSQHQAHSTENRLVAARGGGWMGGQNE